MSDPIVDLKVRCFDLQEANAGLSNYLAEIAKVLGVTDINHVYPTIVKLVQESKDTQPEAE